MQNMSQTTMQKSTINTSFSAKHPINKSHAASLFISDPAKTFAYKNQYCATLRQSRDNKDFTYEKRKKNNCKQDLNLFEHNNYKLRLVSSHNQRIKISKLIKHMYASRGYYADSSTDFIYHSNQTSFEASTEKCVVGTLTLGHDSKNGLLADTLYKEVLEAIRKKNRKICELTRFAIDSQHSSKELLASLFNLVYISARIIHKATDFVIEVNPRHAGYYKRLLGFHQIGELRTCPRVNAPAVLLHLELDYVDTQVACLAGSRDSKQRSLYTYFLTKQDEEKVATKIQQMLTKQSHDQIRSSASHLSINTSQVTAFINCIKDSFSLTDELPTFNNFKITPT